MEISGALRTAIEAHPIAHVVTINPSGEPQISLAWIGLDGDDVVIGTMFDQAKMRNIRRDERIAISFETGTTDTFGLNGYIVLHGRAHVVEGGAPRLLARLAHGYLGTGPDEPYPPMPNPPEGWVIHITVDRVTGSAA